VLTQGTRPAELAAALESLAGEHVIVVNNGGPPDAVPVDANVTVHQYDTNLGVPGGRDAGVKATDHPIIAFLDDDAIASPGLSATIASAFEANPDLGAVATRLVDEHGDVTRRHVPRFGGRYSEASTDATLFIGAGHAIRRTAYVEAGGYWPDLVYGHEEIELSWRLIDRGWRVRYLHEAVVVHPRAEIGRHEHGWRLTGRNRVMIARRSLPWPIASVHVVAWLFLGAIRAPGSAARRAYVSGWLSGWSIDVAHRPIRWATVWRLTRAGRPPVL
jgi:hypothetical protein